MDTVSETYVQYVRHFDPQHTANDVSIIWCCDQESGDGPWRWQCDTLARSPASDFMVLCKCLKIILSSLYLVEGLPGGIGPLPGWLTNYCPSVLDTVGWVILPVKIVPDMTYNVFGGTLNPTLLLLLQLINGVKLPAVVESLLHGPAQMALSIRFKWSELLEAHAWLNAGDILTPQVCDRVLR